MTIERAGRFLGLRRAAAYAAADRGDLPVMRVGRRLLVQTATLARQLGIVEFDRSPRLGNPHTPSPPAHRVKVGSPGGTAHAYRPECTCGWTGHQHTEYRPARLEGDQHQPLTPGQGHSIGPR